MSEEKNKEELRKAQAAAREEEVKRLRESINTVLKTPEGKRVFGYLCRICGFNKSSLCINPTSREVQAESTTYNEAMRKVYLLLRELAEPDLLKEIEYLKENQ
jgi:cytochrome c5